MLFIEKSERLSFPYKRIFLFLKNKIEISRKSIILSIILYALIL